MVKYEDLSIAYHICPDDVFWKYFKIFRMNDQEAFKMSVNKKGEEVYYIHDNVMNFIFKNPDYKWLKNNADQFDIDGDYY